MNPGGGCDRFFLSFFLQLTWYFTKNSISPVLLKLWSILGAKVYALPDWQMAMTPDRLNGSTYMVGVMTEVGDVFGFNGEYGFNLLGAVLDWREGESGDVREGTWGLDAESYGPVTWWFVNGDKTRYSIVLC